MDSLLPTETWNHIFGFLNQTGLLNARYVCHQWNAFALNHSNKIKITIKNSSQMKDFLQAVKSRHFGLDVVVKFNLALQGISSEEIQNFLQVFGYKVIEYNLNVHTNIRRWDLNKSPVAELQIGKKLNIILNASFNTKVLRIINGSYHFNHYYLHEYGLNTPVLLSKLEELCLTYNLYSVYISAIFITFPSLCKWIENAPNLKIFKTDYTHTSNPDNSIVSLFQKVQNISKLYLSLILNNLQSTIDDLLRASVFPIKITGLRVQISGNASGEENDIFLSAFKKFLSSQSVNLRELQVKMDSYSESEYLKLLSFPIMQKLQSLNLRIFTKTTCELKPQQFPQLKSVDIYIYSDINPFPEPFPTVEKLKLIGKYKLSEYRFNVLFPNIKILETSCDSLEDLKYLLFNLNSVERLLVDLRMDLKEKSNRILLWNLFTHHAVVGSESDFYIAGINDDEDDKSFPKSYRYPILNPLKLKILELTNCTHEVVTALAYSSKLGILQRLEKLFLPIAIQTSILGNIQRNPIVKILNECHGEVILTGEHKREFHLSWGCHRFSVTEEGFINVFV